jgi:hypothetical protein
VPRVNISQNVAAETQRFSTAVSVCIPTWEVVGSDLVSDIGHADDTSHVASHSLQTYSGKEVRFGHDFLLNCFKFVIDCLDNVGSLTSHNYEGLHGLFTVVDCLDNVGSLTSHNPIGLPGLLRGQL